MNSSIKGKSVHFDDTYLHVELSDGRIISTPLKWYPELGRATLPQLQNYDFICRGTGVEWLDLDCQLSIEAMLVSTSLKKAA